MLILKRKTDGSIRIGSSIRVTVVKMQGSSVWLGIDAPESVKVHREEVYLAIQHAHHQNVKDTEIEVGANLLGKNLPIGGIEEIIAQTGVGE